MSLAKRRVAAFTIVALLTAGMFAVSLPFVAYAQAQDSESTQSQNSWMDWTTGITIIASILVATSGYIAKYLNDLRLAQRKERLDRIDKQLRELYGPLFALHHTATAAWFAFREKYRKGITPYWSQDNPPNEEEAAAWRLWHTEVFIPINEKIVLLVQEHADLIEEAQMPQFLLDLSVHVAAFKPISKAWETKDYSKHTSLRTYPRPEMEKYVQHHYERLQKEQAKMMGVLRQ